jgi:hypothetical protein
MFIFFPITLGVVPYLIYHYAPHEFIYMTAMLILLYLMLLEEHLFRTRILKEIQEREANELNLRF